MRTLRRCSGILGESNCFSRCRSSRNFRLQELLGQFLGDFIGTRTLRRCSGILGILGTRTVRLRSPSLGESNCHLRCREPRNFRHKNCRRQFLEDFLGMRTGRLIDIRTLRLRSGILGESNCHLRCREPRNFRLQELLGQFLGDFIGTRTLRRCSGILGESNCFSRCRSSRNFRHKNC